MPANEFNLMPATPPEPDQTVPAAGDGPDKARADKPPRSLGDDWARLVKRLGRLVRSLSGRSRRPGGTLATDLIKGEVVTYFDWQKNLVWLAVLLAVDFLLIFGGYKGVEFWQRQKEAEVDAAISKFNELQAEKRLAEVGLDEIVNFQRQLDQIAFMLDRHVHWTNFFNFLEENTLADVYYERFSGSIDGKYTLNATGRDFYEVREQMSLFRGNPYVISAETEGGNIGTRKENRAINFNINLKVRDSIFTDNK